MAITTIFSSYFKISFKLAHWLDELSRHQRRKKEALDRLLPSMAGSFQMTNAELSAQLEQIERSNDPHHDFFSEM
ncbi:Uncharacterized protein HZ326_18046 [Fusarium oxysporum f. sp. albedinis]|nr:Uncharacterized protein HZ326_18046 [Fusarium oxysporum f. sp. albedinis]